MDPAGGEEITGSLVDTERNVIWRKVARREPGKLVCGLQAIASRLHPAIRPPAVDVIFLSNLIDYESRPYHMGRMLHARSSNRETKSVMQTFTLNKILSPENLTLNT